MFAHVVSSVFAHVTFHDGFTPQTHMQHFTQPHTVIGNQLSLCVRKHPVVLSKQDPFCK